MQFDQMHRRDFITLLGGAAAIWPLAARAQQPAPPVIGHLSALSEAQVRHLVAAFRRGLGEVGFIEGRNVALEFRWAEGRFDRLPAMAAELARRPVDLLLAQSPPAALAARAATTTIPIVFVVGFDPIASGLVTSLNRPGGNATGMTLMSLAIGEKRLEMLRELAPKSSEIAMLVNPMTPDAVPEIGSVQAAAQAMGLQLRMFNASTPSEINAALAAMAEQRLGALLVGTDPFFVDRRAELVARVAQLGIPAIYPFREFTMAGGLISYGTRIATAYRHAGIYAGRILKGAKPADLPVMQPTTFELVINLRAASALGIDIPATLHARSDDVIE
jgi:putative tryptophan/tyrosine transport system substrate-binding protein